MGFTAAEVRRFRAVMDDMDAQFVAVLGGRRDMYDLTLEAAVSVPPASRPPGGGVGSTDDQAASTSTSTSTSTTSVTQRTIFLSGMNGAEINEVIGAVYDEIELPVEPVFAVLVPKNRDKVVRDLVEEVHDDHARLRKEREQYEEMQVRDQP